VRLYSSLTRRLEELPPRPGPVRMYVCGPTVYQRIHVGNARPFVVSMWLRRWLALQGYDVVLVENITDINDKIYDAAAANAMSSATLAEQASEWYFEDTALLGLGRPDHEPKASETVGRIITLIDELVERGLAYEVDGDVYFRVASYGDYGQLSGQRPDQVEEQEPNPRKEDPRDFALWKATKPGEDTWWDSPWGRGRPGWHIECSAMAEEFLGTSFEIHGGGLDLVFPHHENELAQSRGAGREFAGIWMHNGMLRFTGEKMSKSVGNVVSLREVVDRWGPATLLLFFMTAHWRKPLDFSDGTMTAADAQVRSLRNRLVFDVGERRSSRKWEDFVESLESDFNTPEALAIIHEWAATGQTELARKGLDAFGIELEADIEIPQDVESLARRRRDARMARDFAGADRLREELAGRGWDVRDVAEEPGYQLVPRT
jgi:cysteinyl-tRNA synthetase